MKRALQSTPNLIVLNNQVTYNSDFAPSPGLGLGVISERILKGNGILWHNRDRTSNHPRLIYLQQVCSYVYIDYNFIMQQQSCGRRDLVRPAIKEETGEKAASY